jgi:hypothetical protein
LLIVSTEVAICKTTSLFDGRPVLLVRLLILIALFAFVMADFQRRRHGHQRGIRALPQNHGQSAAMADMMVYGPFDLE